MLKWLDSSCRNERGPTTLSCFLVVQSPIQFVIPMPPLIILLTSFALLVGLGLPARAALSATEVVMAREQAAEVMDTAVAGFFMSE
jgi:hypothetical protein